MSSRIEQLVAALVADDVEALVVAKGSDIRYLTGFTGEYGTAVLVVSAAGRWLVTDGRFETQAPDEIGDAAEVRIWSGGGVPAANCFTCAGDIIAEEHLGHPAITAADLSVADGDDLRAHARAKRIVKVRDYVAELRMIKDEQEIAAIRRSCSVAMRSFWAVLDTIRPGATELDVANELERQFRARGGRGCCFETIVASGPDNGARPHATAGTRKLAYGDFVTIDFGTYRDGYCSDITRTVVIGRPRDPELREIWSIVERAKELGASLLEPGVSLAAVSDAVCGYVREHGYSIPHGVGHNFGLDIHEPPYLGPRSAILEQPGMVHTLEPGVYVPGLGGARQEDDYLIGERGVERLTYITDHLIEL